MSVASPALRADYLLRSLSLCSGIPVVRRIGVLEHVLEIAGQVRPLYPSDPVPIGFTDSEPALAAIASKLGIDRLSLQCRALLELVNLSPLKARQHLEVLRVPVPSKLTCADYRVARLNQYYDLLRVVSMRSFSPEEVKKGVLDRFLLGHLTPLQSPAHVSGVLYFLAESRLSRESLGMLISALGPLIENIDADDRAFFVHMLAEGGHNWIRVFVKRCEAEGIDATPVLLGIHRYYARHLAKARCADVVQHEELRRREIAALKQFEQLARNDQSQQLANLEDIRPDRLLESTPPRDLMASIPDYQDWFSTLANRRAKASGEGEAAALFDQVADQLEDWKKPKWASEREFFQVRAMVLARLMQQASSDRERARALDANSRFYAAATDMQQSFAAEWLFLFRNFLSVCWRLPGEARAQALAALAANPALALATYVRLDWTARTAASDASAK